MGTSDESYFLVYTDALEIFMELRAQPAFHGSKKGELKSLQISNKLKEVRRESLIVMKVQCIPSGIYNYIPGIQARIL